MPGPSDCKAPGLALASGPRGVGTPALRVGLPRARRAGILAGGRGVTHRLPCPRGHLWAFVLGSQLQTIMSHPHLLTVHDFEQEGSEELDTVILKALVKGEARPCPRRALAGEGGQPARRGAAPTPGSRPPGPAPGAARSAVSVSVCDGVCECLSVGTAVCTQRQHV